MNHPVYLVCLQVKRFISAKHLYLAQQPDSGLSRLVVDVFISHKDIHTKIGLLWKSDRPVAESATYGTHTHNKHKKLMSKSLAGFEPAIPAI
jgi:hypothetical protein